MALLDGHPMIRHVYDKCGIVYPGRMVLIPFNDPLKDYLRAEFIQYHEGPEDDVLTRYTHAVKTYGLPWLVRITGDCPLISPAQIAIVTLMGQSQKADFVTNCLYETTDGQEVEFISSKLLLHIDPLAAGSDREHVTTYIKSHWDELTKAGFRLGSYIDPMPIAKKMSVDTQKDLESAQKMLDKVKNRKRLYV